MQDQKIELPEEWFDLSSQEFDEALLKKFGSCLTKKRLEFCYLSLGNKHRKTNSLSKLGYEIFDNVLNIRHYRHELELPVGMNPKSLSAVKLVSNHLKGPYYFESNAISVFLYSFNQKESSLMMLCQNNLERYCQLVSK